MSPRPARMRRAATSRAGCVEPCQYSSVKSQEGVGRSGEVQLVVAVLAEVVGPAAADDGAAVEVVAVVVDAGGEVSVGVEDHEVGAAVAGEVGEVEASLAGVAEVVGPALADEVAAVEVV